MVNKDRKLVLITYYYITFGRTTGKAFKIYVN